MTFIFNRWVRGNDFFGRRKLLQTIRERQNKPAWILGNRRVGKTSLLRQIEWLCKNGVWNGVLALYWDLQGAATTEGLKDSLLESLEDAGSVAQRLNMDVDELEDYGFAEIMNKFRRKIKALDQSFLLLIDECEELVDVARQDPNILSSFRKLSHSRGFAMIMAGSLRLMDLDESSSRTSPFLPDFLPPLLLCPFDQAETLSLLAANGVGEEAAREIHALSFGNPHLVQVIGEFYLRLGDLDKVMAELKRDQVCHYFFQSNFQCLPEPLRSWWSAGTAVTNLAAMTSDDPNFSYAVQSALLHRNPEGLIRVSPLLRMVLGGEITQTVQAPSIPAPEPPPLLVSPVPVLRDRSLLLAVLPSACLGNRETELIKLAHNPPSLNMVASLNESNDKIHAVLDGASPEYVLGLEPDERTSVYLAGLFLYRLFFPHSPFAHMRDPWERSGAIADRDVIIKPEETAENDIPAKTAMIIMRCLKSAPQARYPSLDALEADLAG